MNVEMFEAPSNFYLLKLQYFFCAKSSIIAIFEMCIKYWYHSMGLVRIRWGQG